MYRLSREGRLSSFTVDESRLSAAVDAVVEVTRAAYPDVARIPYHARYRHFGAGGVNRLARLEAQLAAYSPAERLAARVELVITSVLLDAGAGPAWRYREPSGATYARSEGLAVASYDWFESGGLSADPSRPLRADASVLSALDEPALARAFQVSPDNPLVGLSGRVSVLAKLGEVVRARHPRVLRGPPAAARQSGRASHFPGAVRRPSGRRGAGRRPRRAARHLARASDAGW
jgi:hypothetical protein